MTITGRLPSEPNQQGIPIRTIEGKRIKEALSPKVYFLDLSNIEKRIRIHLRQKDKEL